MDPITETIMIEFLRFKTMLKIVLTESIAERDNVESNNNLSSKRITDLP
jgi:hypothetical protein